MQMRLNYSLGRNCFCVQYSDLILITFSGVGSPGDGSPGVLPLLQGSLVVSCRGLVVIDVLEGSVGDCAAVHPALLFEDLLAGVQKVDVSLLLYPEP